ncbi:unnamed protein product [Closterium sp. NIES-64]|nr:unnamed protein product [Closterium sp. NIES-64]
MAAVSPPHSSAKAPSSQTSRDLTAKPRRPSSPRNGGSSSSDSAPPRLTIFDGKQIRRRMHDDAAFTAFLSHEFDRLDADGNGALSLGELKPALLRLGELLGMPPAGTAREVDELVEGLFASFMSPDLTEEIGRDSFVRDPLSTLVYDGGALRRILGSAEEAEALISALFAELDTDGSGCISKSELRPALVRLGLHGGDSTTAEAREHQEQVLERIIDRYCLDGDGELCRDEFSALLLDVFKDLSSELEAAPLYLPQRATVLNGAYIKKILNDDEFFTAVSDSMFEEWDVSHKGYLVCTDAIAGFRKLGLAYGLPPPDAAEADKVYTSLFLSADVNLDGFVDKGEFRTLLRSLFIGMQLQLEETPLVLESSVEPKGESRSDGTESVFDGPKLLALLREEGGGQRVRRFLEEKFQEMDKDGRGRVPREAVRAVVAHVEQTSALPSPRRTSFQAPQKRAEQTSGLPSPRRTFSAGSPGVGGRRGERESQALLESARRRGNIAPAGIAAGNAAGDAGSGDWESAEQEVACEEFVDAMMRVLQRMGDAVHDDPILQFMADGAKMQRLMEEEGELATLIDILFSSLDTDGSGTISSCELKPALSTMVQNMGLHTLCRSASTESVVAQLVMTHGKGRLDLSRDQFTAFMRATVSDLAGRLAAKPEEEEEGQVLDGSKLRQQYPLLCSSPPQHPPAPLSLSPFSPLSPSLSTLTLPPLALSPLPPSSPSNPGTPVALPEDLSSGTGGSSRRSGRTPSPPGTCPGSAASPPLPTPSQSTPFPPSPALPSHLSPHQILGDRRLFQKICEDTFTSWDVSRKRCLSRADISAGLARSGMMWGLPPHNARNAEEVYDRFFLKADLDRSGSVERAEFNVFLRGVFRSMAEELEKNPLVVHTSKVRPPNAGSL